MNLLQRLFVACLAWLLAACAALPPAVEEPPTLRLSPASLGRDLSLQQRMTVSAHGQSQQLDVAIEADAQAVRMAVLAFGQTVARLAWDGHVLDETRDRNWPAAITGARVLNDFQLVHWPLAAIAAALPPGWSVREEAGVRVLRSGERIVLSVRYPAAGSADLENLASGYRVRLDAWPTGGTP